MMNILNILNSVYIKMKEIEFKNSQKLFFRQNVNNLFKSYILLSFLKTYLLTNSKLF
jgi:hypothetical protein